MTSKHALLGILAAIAALTGYGAISTRSASPDPTEAFILACETALADVLVSPSSYRRIDVTGPFLDPLTLQWYRDHHGDLSDWEQGSERERDLAATLIAMTERHIAEGRQVATAAIRYEASNRLGVSLAGRALCETVTPPQGLPDDPSELTEIWINGQDSVARRLR